ncbi:MAG: MFS transporter [Marmoricola sp.]|nr:MFS transporter [Marmoricola sp.]
MPRLDGATRRAVSGHAAGALALSLPWPLLLVRVAEHTDAPLALGVAGSARMVPYVACSWAAGRLADRVRRDRLIRATLAVRGALLVLAAAALAAGLVWVAVVASSLAVAAATPAYPALVAGMPGLAGTQSRRATDVLVTVEVAAFVVGAAAGGLLLQPVTRGVAPWLPVALVVLAAVLLAPVRLPRAVATDGPTTHRPLRAVLAQAPAARRAMGAMAVVNLAVSLVALALLPLALGRWGSDETGYGVATAVLGFAACAAPALSRLGRSPDRSSTIGMVLLAVGLVLVVPVPSLAWSLLPLAVVGAASVAVEASATVVMQDELPDSVRASVLGLNDAVIIASALVGALVAAPAIALLGGPTVLVVTAGLVLGAAWWARPRRRAGAAATVEVTRREDHGSLDPPAPRAAGAPAVPARGVRLRRVGCEPGPAHVGVGLAQRVPDVRRAG